MASPTEYTKNKECEVKALPIEDKKRLIREGKAYWFFPDHVAEQIIICGLILMILITITTLFPAHLGESRSVRHPQPYQARMVFSGGLL